MSNNSLLTNESLLNALKFSIGSGGGGGGGTVTGVTATAPIVSSGGAAPVISLQASGVTAAVVPVASTAAGQLNSITIDAFGRITAYGVQ